MSGSPEQQSGAVVQGSQRGEPLTEGIQPDHRRRLDSQELEITVCAGWIELRFRTRTDSDLRMESRSMRMFGGGPTAEIVRLDEGKIYQLDLEKTTFAEMSLAEQLRIDIADAPGFA